MTQKFFGGIVLNLEILLKSIGVTDVMSDEEVTSVTENIQNVIKGSIYVAVKGNTYDGNDNIGAAFERGACCVISENEQLGFPVVTTENARVALSRLCSVFYGEPQKRMKMIGVTGTNGKTTVSEYIAHLLNVNGKKCAVIGTLGSKVGDCCNETGFTTPSSEVLFSELKKFADDGCEYCVVEVSSQAIVQQRTEPIKFSLGVFTNIGRDHLDYHGSFEEYIKAKARLFSACDRILLNMDDEFCSCMIPEDNDKVFFYSATNSFADFNAKNVFCDEGKINYYFICKDGIEKLSCEGLGNISVYNTLAAASAVNILGLSLAEISENLASLPRLKGRMQRICSGGVCVYIDFAHTPQALMSVLIELSGMKKRRILTVFGCGGNRDKSKRKEMGRIADVFSDVVIITSDNPRNEDPNDIISDISKGIKNKKKIVTIVDRYEAVSYALNNARDGDIVLVAGKGHEQYQVVGDKKSFFSDEITVKKILGLM